MSAWQCWTQRLMQMASTAEASDNTTVDRRKQQLLTQCIHGDRLDLSEIKVLARDLEVDLSEDEVKEAFQVLPTPLLSASLLLCWQQPESCIPGFRKSHMLVRCAHCSTGD